MGAIIVGPLGGAFLGFVFGMVCFLMGLLGLDPFTYFLISTHPILTFLTCVVKGVAAGLVAGLIYKLLNKKNEKLSVVLAALAAPVVNTGLFIVGALLMKDSISVLANASSVNVMYFLLILCSGVNFLVEFALNGIIAPSLCSVIKYFKRSR